MALLQTPEPNRGFKAPDFSLPGTDGKTYSFADVKGEKGTVVMFICNHCPYVKAITERMVHDIKTLQTLGYGAVAIMPNDTVNYPEDSFENMKDFAEDNHFSFPYLLDESQSVARAYGAVCTPDIFGFNANGELQYRGRLDSAGKGERDNNTVKELEQAMIQIGETGRGPDEQYPSMGCSIKWKKAA